MEFLAKRQAQAKYLGRVAKSFIARCGTVSWQLSSGVWDCATAAQGFSHICYVQDGLSQHTDIVYFFGKMLQCKIPSA